VGSFVSPPEHDSVPNPMSPIFGMALSPKIDLYARRTVVTPALHALAISRHDLPCFRSSATFPLSKIALGLPTGFPERVPCALARLNPALTRSEIRMRSCFAIHAATAIISSPAGPVVRKYSYVRLTN